MDQTKQLEQQVAHWRHTASEALSRAAIAERERDSALQREQAERDRADGIQRRLSAAHEIIAGQIGHENAIESALTDTQSKLFDAESAQHWQARCEGAQAAAAAATAEAVALRRHIAMLERDQALGFSAGAEAMREKIAAVVEAYPKRDVAQAIAAKIRHDISAPEA